MSLSAITSLSFSFAATLLPAMLFLLLHFLYKEKAIGWFGLFWLAYSAKLIVDYAAIFGLPELWVLILSRIAIAFVILFLMYSLYSFDERPVPKWLFPLILAFLLHSIFARHYNPDSLLITKIPQSLIFAFFFLWGVKMFYITKSFAPLVKPVVAGLFVLWGFFQVFYFIVEDQETYVVMGRFLTAVLKLLVASGVLMAYFVRAKDSLKLGEARLKQVIDLVPLGVFAKNERGEYLLVNQAAAQFVDMDEAAILGRTNEDLLPDPEEVGTLRRIEDRVFKTGEPIELEKDITLLNGEKRTLHFNKIPFTTWGSDEKAILGIATDITLQRRMEAEKKLLRRQLDQAQKLEAIGRLSGGIAHDFNNLLTSIIGNTAFLIKKTPQSEKGLQYLGKIKDASELAVDLTKQLLAFSRKQKIQPKVLDINREIQSFADMLQRLIGENVKLDIQCAQSLKAIEADLGQLKQILINLAINAKDAMVKGGKLTIETFGIDADDEEHQLPSSLQHTDCVIIRVTDTGTGMDEATKRRIFEPFFTTKDVNKGTGLGLSMVYGIMKKHEGEIHVESEIGQGTTFTLYFPASEKVALEEISEAELPEEGMPEEEPEKRRWRIFIVEDEPMVQDIAVRILETAGFEVQASENGALALEALQKMKHPPHCLMTDVILPGMDGMELAQKALEIHPQMKIVFTSGYTDDVILDSGLLRQEVNFIEKPYLPDVLIKKIRNVVES